MLVGSVSDRADLLKVGVSGVFCSGAFVTVSASVSGWAGAGASLFLVNNSTLTPSDTRQIAETTRSFFFITYLV